MSAYNKTTTLKAEKAKGWKSGEKLPNKQFKELPVTNIKKFVDETTG